VAFSAPVFNITCGIYTVALPSTLTLRLLSLCNLALGRRINWPWYEGTNVPGQSDGYTCALLLPALTDVRSKICGTTPDIVECPDGSGRWYQVMAVEDVGKGFANEYRIATLIQVRATGDYVGLGIPNWPVPIP